MKPWKLGLGAAAAGLLTLLTIGPAAADVQPAAVEINLDPGASHTLDKTVNTPTIPPNPDVIFLADTTGSMGGAIGNVKAGAGNIMTTVQGAQPTAQFGAASYKDFNCDAVPYRLDQAITASQATVQAAVNSWSAGGGCDEPEAQLNALYQLATDPAVGFRSGSSRVIAWFGDAPGHDPSNGATLASTIAALQAAGIRVIAVSTGANRLDLTGQASAIASATGGVFLSGVSDAQVANAILAGLSNLPATVTWSAVCDSGLSVSLSPASQTVPSGTAAVFTETISLDASAPQGGTLGCKVSFQINGLDAGADFVQTVTVHVNDITPPVAQCVETTNPSGNNVPKSGPNAGNSGQNPDGFYQLSGTDNVGVASIVVYDSGSSFVSNPFASGDKVKITQTPGGTPSDTRPGPGGLVSHLKLNGDAIVVVTDTSGNVTRATCLVAPKPK